ncbi:MAG TPA: efflux RND transporter periplasmic adaptor subunit [Bryobacteraceae bacterium]|jgi:RND family efflux transporter MFP subunit|nr:efflux RND transporter periplasmic adaptor subunit [Bryobacteraceae bacterium]
MKHRNSVLILCCAFALAPASSGRTDDLLVAVVAKPVSRMADLPGEILPFLSVSLHAKVSGYVERILVDRGSMVKQGQLLAELSAPEMAAQIAEIEPKIQSVEADRLQAEAQLASLESTYASLKKAAETPGAIAGIELVQMEKQIEAARALIESRQANGRALEANRKALQEVQAYLRITAPFDGVITDRYVHPGALLGTGADSPLVMLQQISRLRLVVAVPEEDAGSVAQGARVEFHVPAFPERGYSGTIARSAHELDPKTRTMAVELDVMNGDGSLSPGMYPTVKWPIRRPRAALMVPPSSVVTTTERTFVIRNHDGRAEWVDVRKGSVEGGLIEVSGDLHAGDQVIRRATDEIRNGSSIQEK